jgi:hypothetical protein
MKRRRWLLYLMLLLVPLSGCDSGDRVLVAKFLYDSQLSPPSRYDVVVFKYPQSPVENGTPKNYIKRLLGLPGELIAIFFGRLYRFAAPEGFPKTAREFEDMPEATWAGLNLPITKNEWRRMASTAGIEANDLWRDPPKDHATALKLWQGKKFEILRKPPAVMLALSRPVFDNDYQAKDLKGVLPDRWAPHGGTSWQADGPTGFSHAGNGSAEEWLHYRHILRPPDWPPAKIHDPNDMGNRTSPKFVDNPSFKTTVEAIRSRKHWPQLITDFLGYNTYEVGEHSSHPAQNWVGDLMLECKLTVVEPKGQFWMEVSRGVDRFQARFNLQTGVCTLYRLERERGAESKTFKAIKLAEAETRVKGPGEYALRFANYDERLTVWVNRDLPFQDGHAYTLPEGHPIGPDTELDTGVEHLDDIRNNDLQPANLCSVGAAVKVQSLKLWRDGYYTGNFTSSESTADHERGAANATDKKYDKKTIQGDDWKSPAQWDILRNPATVRTIYVYPGHYLCLGDNSPESSDSRFWGLVPDRLMLGRALLVYFPFNRAGRIK